MLLTSLLLMISYLNTTCIYFSLEICIYPVFTTLKHVFICQSIDSDIFANSCVLYNATPIHLNGSYLYIRKKHEELITKPCSLTCKFQRNMCLIFGYFINTKPVHYYSWLRCSPEYHSRYLYFYKISLDYKSIHISYSLHKCLHMGCVNMTSIYYSRFQMCLVS